MSLSTSLFMRRALLCAAAGPFLLLTGCANMLSTAPADNALDSSAGLTGIVHGGQQPIVGATVTLWAAGNAGYGSAATQLASTTTSATGTFTFHPSGGANYTCPLSSSSTESQYIYLTSEGGQPTTSVTNSAAYLMLALGKCSTVLAANPYVVINEVTTVASVFALQQFFNPTTESIGTSATNITGLANAFATVNNLITASTGTANASSTASAAITGYTTAPVVTITPEQSKINTMANALAACVNTNGTASSACATLFNNVSSTTATDTLQAAYYMATNPTSTTTTTTSATCSPSTVTTTTNICNIFGIAVANPPFQPSLASTAPPTDWSIGVTYGSSSGYTSGSNTIYLLNDPTYLAVDGSGNIWVLNDDSTTAASANSLTEFSPTGVPVAQVLTNTMLGPSSIAIDPSGNAWVSIYGSGTALQSSVLEYTTGGTTNTFTTNEGPQRLAIDGKGDVFVIEPSYKGLGDLEEIPTTCRPSNSTPCSTATTLASGLTTDFTNLAIDSNYTVWVTGGGTGASGGTAGYPYVYQFLYSAVAPHYPSTPSATTNAGGITAPEQAISIDSSNNVWVENYGKELLSGLYGTSAIMGTTNSPITVSANLSKPEFQVTDGAGNTWVTDAATTTATPAGSVFEVSTTTVATNAPSVGFTHTYNEPYGIAVDPSGNVWVAAYNAAGPAGFITEIVGQAVPVVTPLAAGLPITPGGTSTLGTRP
jgi:hypothetical protein